MTLLTKTRLTVPALLILLASGGCSGAVVPNLGGGNDSGGSSGGSDAAGSGSGSGGSSSGGSGSGSGSGSSSGGSADAGSCRQATDCHGVLPQVCMQCQNGTTACAHWECRSGSCVSAFCPAGGAQDAGAVSCGSSTCRVGGRCCDHCTGSCVNALSGANCPDDNNPTHACSDAGSGTCAQQGGSCSSAQCCAGLSCCSGVPIPAGQAICYSSACPISDRNMKAGFTQVQTDAVLDGVLSLPLTRWHYKFEPPEIQHIGPMAQDFKAAFGVGVDDKHIFQIDADGVSFAAIQALSRKLEAVVATQRTLERDNADLRAQVQHLQAQVAAARAAGAKPGDDSAARPRR